MMIKNIFSSLAAKSKCHPLLPVGLTAIAIILHLDGSISFDTIFFPFIG
jgi:hypothetical protein